MKLAIVTSGLDIGGAETQIAALAPRLSVRGWDVTILSILGLGQVSLQLQAADVHLVDLGLNNRGIRLKNLIEIMRMLLRLSRNLRQLKPDIVHSHMVPANLACRIIRNYAQMPSLVCTAHSIVEPPVWKNYAYRLTDRMCDLTTNICKSGVEQSIRDGRVPANRIIHVPNGVDTGRFRNNFNERKRLRKSLGLDDRFVWLAVGRLSWEKDWQTMMTAIRSLKDFHDNSTLLVAGDGPLMNDIRNLVGSLRLNGCVRFLGVRNDTPSLYCAADGFLMSSVIEGLPMVLLEASSCELPIVATAVGGVSEIVENGVTGFLVEKESPDRLAESIHRMQTLPTSERENMGRAARERTCDLFDIEKIVTRWEEIYRGLKQKSARKEINEIHMPC